MCQVQIALDKSNKMIYPYSKENIDMDTLKDEKSMDMYDELFYLFQAGLNILNQKLKDSGIFIELKEYSSDSKKQHNYNNYTPQQKEAITLVINDALTSFLSMIAYILNVPFPDVETLSTTDIDENILADTQKIIQHGVNKLVPEFEKMGIIFKPHELGNAKIITYDQQQEYVLETATADLFETLLDAMKSIFHEIVSSLDKDAIPDKKDVRYLN